MVRRRARSGGFLTLTQMGFCPRCGQHSVLHELHQGDGTYRRFRKPCDRPKLYCERCIDRIKHQQAMDRKASSFKRYEFERKYGKHGRTESVR